MLACTKFWITFPIIFMLNIWTTEFWTIVTAENLFGLLLDIPTLSLISIFCITATLSLIRKKAFVSVLLYFALLLASILFIRTFLVFSTPPVNISNSRSFHVILVHVNFSIDMLKQPWTLNVTFPVLQIVTLYISIISLLCSEVSHLSLFFSNIKSPLLITKSFIWIVRFSYSDISRKLTAWLLLLTILSEIETHNWNTNLFWTTRFLLRVLNPWEKVVRMFTLKLIELMFKVKMLAARAYRKIVKV